MRIEVPTSSIPSCARLPWLLTSVLATVESTHMPINFTHTGRRAVRHGWRKIFRRRGKAVKKWQSYGFRFDGWSIFEDLSRSIWLEMSCTESSPMRFVEEVVLPIHHLTHRSHRMWNFQCRTFTVRRVIAQNSMRFYHYDSRAFQLKQ